MQQGESPYAETALAINTDACTKVARRSPKPLVVGSIPYRPCQAREKKPMIAAVLFANRFGVSWSEVSLVLYGPLARRSSGWLITGWPRFDSWMGYHRNSGVNKMSFEIVPMTLKEANAFVEQNHRHHGKVVGHKFSIGLSNGEEIVGVAIPRPSVLPLFQHHHRQERECQRSDGVWGGVGETAAPGPRN